MGSRPLDAGMWDLGPRYDNRSHRGSVYRSLVL